MEFELPPVLDSAPGMRAAELVIDGLSVCCFNKINTEKFWEVAYPHKALHQLRITIHALDAARKEIEPPLHDVQVTSAVKTFGISLTNGSLTHYEPNHFPLGGPSDPHFDREVTSPLDNPHDLGWMVDLAGEELKHGNAVLLPGDPSRSVSLARIRHSLFCTLEPEEQEVRISPINQGSPTSAGSFSLPLNNTQIVGVLLGTGPGEIRFESDPAGSLNINPLPYSQTQRYRIKIINEDSVTTQPHEPPFVRGDLQLFYGLVIEVDGVQKDLWAHSRIGPVVPEGDCHPNRYGGATLQPLIAP